MSIDPPIRSVDLTRQYRQLQAQMDAAIQRVLASGQFILGAETASFEQEFAAYLNAPAAAGVACGTDAIELALRTAAIDPGAEVITAANTAVGTVAAIERAGARPVLVDVSEESLTMDAQRLPPAISARTRAIIPVHLYGCPADLSPILAFAQNHHLTVIEDCAQAHGAQYRLRKVGTWGDLGAFSFYPTKNLGAYGDGGALVINHPEWVERGRALRQYGWHTRYISQESGINSRLDELQAAILRVKLPYLEQWNLRRRHLAARYRQNLTGVGSVRFQESPAEADSVFHQMVIRIADRDAVQRRLTQAGVQTQVLYPQPIHLQPAYQSLGYQLGDFPVSERASVEILSLPLYPELTDDEVDKVCAALIDVLSA